MIMMQEPLVLGIIMSFYIALFYRTKSLVDRCGQTLSSWKLGQITDLVLGLTLLGGPSPYYRDFISHCLEVLQTNTSIDDLDTEEISNLAWACQRTGLPLPSPFVDFVEGGCAK